MTYTVAFLHSADVHVKTFDRLIEEDGLAVRTVHEAREDWLDRARSRGIDDDLRAEVHGLLAGLAHRADVVVCTCSTLGPVAESLGDARVLRIDAPMMERAAALGSEVLLVLCLESTIDASLQLLERSFVMAGRTPNVRLLMVPEAWAAFEAGDSRSFTAAIVRRVGAALSAEPGVECVVLGQASMLAAQTALHDVGVPVLVSPDSMLAHLHELLDRASRPG